jgi:hypothetical protein
VDLALAFAPLYVPQILLILAVRGTKKKAGLKAGEQLVFFVVNLVGVIGAPLVMIYAIYALLLPSGAVGMWNDFLPFFEAPSFVKEISQHPFPGSLILLFAASFLMGLPIAILTSPPLPRAKIIQNTPEGRGGSIESSSIEGQLVAHSDGFWHIFVGAEGQHELQSIPDSKVLAVCMLGDVETTTPEEDTKPVDRGEG